MKNDRTDDELRGLAMAAFDAHERSVGSAETESALTAVRERVADGGTAPVVALEAHRNSKRPSWQVLGAAAAAVAVVGAGLIAVIGGGQSDPDVLTPVTDPVTVPESTVQPTTVPELVTPPEPDTTATTTVVVDSAVVDPQVVPVDFAAPPQLIEPTPFVSIPLAENPNGNRLSVGIGSDSVVVYQPDTSFVTIAATGADRGDVRTLDVDDALRDVVVGPGNVAYGFGEVVFSDDGGQMLPVVAIALDGGQAGQVLASTELGVAQWLELPPYPLGSGAEGVIARVRRTNETLLDYVDGTGWLGGEPLLVSTEIDGDVLDVSTASGVSWRLDVVRDPNAADSFVGPGMPAPTSDGRVVYFDRIGAATDPTTDFSPNTMPVVAVLNPDGSGSWVRLPDEWDVITTDVWGTVLARTIDGSLELALLDDALEAPADTASPADDTTPDSEEAIEDSPAPPPGPAPTDPQALAIPNNCLDEFNCTKLAVSEGGLIVSYDPTDDTLRTYDAAGVNELSAVALAEPLSGSRPFIVHVGPDDVVYVGVFPDDAIDPVLEVVAIPLVGPNAGSIVARTAGLDGTGDTDLVPGLQGLISVSCCGGPVRPEPGAATAVEYVNRDGRPINSLVPSFVIVSGNDGGDELTMTGVESGTTVWSLPTLIADYRGMPEVIPTDDGGALLAMYSELAMRMFVVDFDTDWPEFGIDASDVYILDEGVEFDLRLLERSGSVILTDDSGNFVRRSLDEVGSPSWGGDVEVDFETGVVTVDGLNEYITAQQPNWAADVDLFGVQFAPAAGVNERVEVEWIGATQEMLVTTTGLLDDSTQATRFTIQTERLDDGLLRFVSGTYGWQCQPGRGHQDFSVEFCT